MQARAQDQCQQGVPRLLTLSGTPPTPRASHHPPPPAGTPTLTPLSPTVFFLLPFSSVQGRPHPFKGEYGCGVQGSLASLRWPGSSEGRNFHFCAPAQLKCQPQCCILTHFPPLGIWGRGPCEDPMPAPCAECGCWGIGREQKWGICWAGREEYLAESKAKVKSPISP